MKILLSLVAVLVLTTSGYAQWTELSSGTTKSINDTYFLNKDTGYCVGNSGLILKTLDGGATWLNISSDTDNLYRNVYFRDEQTGWLCGYGAAQQTTNGGQTFVSLDSLFGNTDTTKQLFIAEIMGAKEGTVIIQGFFRDIPQTEPGNTYYIITRDGGITWQAFNYPGGYVQLVTPEVLYSANFYLHKSTDSGLTWTNIPNVMFGFPPLNWKCFKVFDALGNGWASLQYEMNFVTIKNNSDSIEVVASGTNNLISANFNGGRSYFLQPNPTGFKILKSTDSGYTFDLITSNAKRGLWYLYFLSDDLGYVCGDSGKIYKYYNHNTSIAPLSLTSKLKIFPNPAKSNIRLQYDNLHIQGLQLVDLSGRSIKNFPVESKMLDVSGLVSGVYFLKVKAREGGMTKKVIVTGQ